MRINQYLAAATGLSRRAADAAVQAGRVRISQRVAVVGDQVEGEVNQAGGRAAVVRLDDTPVRLPAAQTMLFHKPVGYITSRRQQGKTPTIYALLPPELHQLKPVGRLDRDSSGLLLLTNDGQLAQRLQHPGGGKLKLYVVELDRRLQPAGAAQLRSGVALSDGPSVMQVRVAERGGRVYVSLSEGRNRQIRRSFAALGYRVVTLHRTSVGSYTLGNLAAGHWRAATTASATPKEPR